MKNTRYKFTDSDIKIIQDARRSNKDKRVEMRLVALEMRAHGVKAKDVSAKTGFHYAYITKLTAKYRDGGISAIVDNHYHGNRRNMTFEEEEALLKPFTAAAEKGQMVEISEINAAYENAVGHTIGSGQIYYVLHRHGWRKVMPRSKHPKKASEEAIEASKKLNPNTTIQKENQKEKPSV